MADEVSRLAAMLSDYERQQLLALLTGVVVGDRPWEGDVGIFYNDFVKLRSMAVGDDPSLLVPGPGESEDGIYAAIPIVRSVAGAGDPIALPRMETLDVPLSRAVFERESHRDFSGSALPLSTLSTLLAHACGVRTYAAAYGYTRFPMRTFPSVGGLQSPEVYLFVRAVDGLEPGIYHFRPLDHAVELIQGGEHAEILRGISLGQPWLETASAVLAVTGCYDRVRWKYGERAYRYLCMDAGFLGQNIYLACEGLRIGACAIAGFLDDAVQSLLRVDGRDEIVLMLIAVGPLAEDDALRRAVH